MKSIMVYDIEAEELDNLSKHLTEVKGYDVSKADIVEALMEIAKDDLENYV